MSDGFAYLDIIFFAMVAAFIAYRLRSVLGRRMGPDRRRPRPVVPPEVGRGDNVTPFPDRQPASEPASPVEEPAVAAIVDDAVRSGLAQIRRADPSFTLDGFLRGAKAAFGMIVEAFGRGDRGALRPLLADRVYGELARAIDDRERRRLRHTTELVGIRSAEVAAAEMRGTRARVAVRFASEQINATLDPDGKLVDGDPKQVAEVADLWTFERDTRSRDPNWTLVETGPAL
jgi:predicted lipid-binding transport protein (Tim44 family)